MAKVKAYIDKTTHELESADNLIQRFKREVARDEILLDCKKHKHFMKKSLKRKEKSLLALKRMKQKMAKNRRKK